MLNCRCGFCGGSGAINWQLRCAKPVCLWFTKDCQLGPQWAVQIDWLHWSWTLAMIYGQQMTALTNLVIFTLNLSSLINTYYSYFHLVLHSTFSSPCVIPSCAPVDGQQPIQDSKVRTMCEFAEIPPATFSVSFCERFQPAFTLGVPRSICISFDYETILRVECIA